jgi:hypothetical protein
MPTTPVVVLKALALAVTLTCVGTGSSAPDAAPLRRAEASSPVKCRLYFGCAPGPSTRTTLSRREEEPVQ